MKYSHAFVVMIFAVILFSCKKHVEPRYPSPAEQDKKILLKDLSIAPLSDPYYHFEYNTQGLISKAYFGGSASVYDVSYNGTRISEMKSNNIINKDRLQYNYDNTGKLSVINFFNEAGIFFRRSNFSYTGPLLTGILWEHKDGNNFITDRTMTLAYQPDSNVSEINDHIFPIGQQPEIISVIKYSLYDNKINIDGFSLIHDIRDHLFLLPGVQIQKNNPGKITYTGTLPNFIADYTYTFNANNTPAGKTGDVLFTTGPDIGQRDIHKVTYTYY